MKPFLIAAAVLAWAFGIMLLANPAAFYAPTGITMTPLIATLPQAHGATLVGVGTILWFGRAATGPGLSAILLGNLVIQVLSLGVVVRTMTLGPGGAVAPGLVIHLLLGAGFTYFWLRSRRS